MKRNNFFRNGLIAAVLLITLGYTACSDDLDYDGSSSNQFSGTYGSDALTNGYNPLVGDSVQQYAGLVLSQIYFTGSGSTVRDQYIKIANISGDTIDAKGVVVLESKFNSVTAYYDFTPPIDSVYFVTGVIYQIPGTKLIPPGDSILLAYQKAEVTDGLDLSDADYAWEGDTGPKLTKIFSYSLTQWVLHNRGFTSYAIAALPDSTATDTTKLITRDWKYEGTYKLDVYNATTGVTTTYNYTASKAYKIPNEWIIDAVHVWAPQYNTNVVQTIPPVLDYGYTYAGDTLNNNSPNRYKYAVTRRDSTGNISDTNNSSSDFIPNDYIY
jgi:hypothetical protein